MNTPQIELEGTAYPICFPTAALAEFEYQAGISTYDFLTQLDENKVSFIHVCKLVAAGLNSGARKTGVDVKYTAEQAGDIFGLYDIKKLLPILGQYLNISTATGDEKNAVGATLTEATTPEAQQEAPQSL